jgi:hypothetical protein
MALILKIKISRIALKIRDRSASSDSNIDKDPVETDLLREPAYGEPGIVIYDFIGTRATMRTDTPIESTTNDLIGALHAQYCQAIHDPLAPSRAEWTVPTTPTHEPLSATPVGESQQGQSIETLLSGSRSIEDVFGTLAAGDASDPAEVPNAPEVLRLFTPPEFNSHASRLPPALVRREHHAVGIDSPLLTSGVATFSSDFSADAPPAQSAALKDEIDAYV